MVEDNEVHLSHPLLSVETVTLAPDPTRLVALVPVSLNMLKHPNPVMPGFSRTIGFVFILVVLAGALGVAGVPVKSDTGLPALQRTQTVLQAEQDWKTSGLHRLLGNQIYDYPRVSSFLCH